VQQHQAFTLKNLAGVTQVDYDPILGGLKDGTGKMHLTWLDKSWPLLAASVDSYIWTCIEGIWQLYAVGESHTVVGGSGATVQLVVCPGSVAIGSGTAQLTAALDLTVTAPAKSFGTLIASPTLMYKGDSLAVDLSGTLTGLVGQLTYLLKRIA
jgi:hypothetical protein